jgi:hypothetical protein
MKPESFNVQRVATGLISALDIKEGRTPSYLGQDYVASLDVLELLLQDSARTNASTTPAPANGYVASGLFVPNGEVWMVTNFSGRIVTGAGVTVASAQVGYERQQNAGNPFAASGLAVAVPASSNVLFGGPIGTKPVFLRQGDTVGLFCHGVVGVATGQAQIDYYRLRV